MWPMNNLTQMLGIKLPIIQAPMAGGITTPALVAAVSNAGGLGSLGAGYMQPNEIRNAIREIRLLTNKPFAVNLFIPDIYKVDILKIRKMQKIIQNSCDQLKPKIKNKIKSMLDLSSYIPIFDEQIKVILEENVSVFSFTFGVLAENYIKKFKDNKVLLIGTATHLAEAKILEKNNIDVIVAQGSEAGGHRGTFIGSVSDGLIGLMAFIPQLIDQIKIPVIASGGIMDARGIIASMALGASGVQMGTAFLSCTESGASPVYKKMLLNADANYTVLTRAFSGKTARGMNNKFIKNMITYENEILDYPIQNVLTLDMRIASTQQSNPEFMSLYAGQGAHLCKSIKASDLILELNKNVIDLLSWS